MVTATNIADIQTVADLTADFLKIQSPVVRVVKIQRGYADPAKNLITIPEWVFERGESYAIYYVAHEISHLSVPTKAWASEGSHGKTFKLVEDSALKAWGLSIRRAKAYPKEIFAGPKLVYSKQVRKPFGLPNSTEVRFLKSLRK